MPRPLLLLDIGGVICIQGAFGAEGSVEVGGATRSLAPEVGGKLRELLVHFELAWASAWGAAANSNLGPALGLPPLDYVRFGSDGEFGENYKLPGVRDFVSGRAAAWVDDDLGAGCLEWARTREQPTLLVETDPHAGLAWDHVDELISFADANLEGNRSRTHG